MKKILKYTLLVILFLILVFVYQNYPASSDAKNLARITDTLHLRKNLELILNTPAARTYQNTSVLDTVAERIKQSFLESTSRVSFQSYTIDGKEYKNVIASFGPEEGERIVVGAHYDVCGDQDGADDNASGVAGILELANLLKGKNLRYRIDLVTFSLEEPPYFDTKKMGSYIHAKSLYDSHIPVKGMISLEMIGYYSDIENSQGYPIGIMKWIYGNKGNYITVVQKSFCGSFAKQFKEISFLNNTIPTKAFRAPSFFGGINLSDHKNYWKFGYSAVMVTNTAFFRNDNYHEETDKVETLDISKMALTIDGVFRTLTQLE